MIPYWEPWTLDLGPVDIDGFGLFVGIGLFVGVLVLARKLGRDGYDPEKAYEILIVALLAAVLGGHLFHILWYEPEQLVGEGARFAALWDALRSGSLPAGEDLPNLLQVWHGLSSFGGFFTVALVAALWVRWHRVSVWPFLDASMVAFTACWVFARIGCFVTHDHPGVETDFVLGVLGTCPGDASLACHALGLYEVFWSAAMWAAFTWADRRPRHPGFYTGWVFATYGPFRFLIDFLRHPGGDARYLGLTPAQYGSLVLCVAGAVLLVRMRGRPPMRGLPVSDVSRRSLPR